MILVDTSVWIEVFARPPRVSLDLADGFDDIVTCLPVVQEVLQGFSHEHTFRVARDSMLALPMVEAPVSQDVYLEAVDLYRRARRAGLTIRSSADCLIAACALRHGLTVLHHDRDFDQIAKIAPLDAEAITRGKGPQVTGSRQGTGRPAASRTPRLSERTR